MNHKNQSDKLPSNRNDHHEELCCRVYSLLCRALDFVPLDVISEIINEDNQATEEALETLIGEGVAVKKNPSEFCDISTYALIRVLLANRIRYRVPVIDTGVDGIPHIDALLSKYPNMFHPYTIVLSGDNPDEQLNEHLAKIKQLHPEIETVFSNMNVL